MNREAEIAARLTEALVRAAEDAAGGPTSLVSVSIEMPARGAGGNLITEVLRKTRTLVFMRATMITGHALIATASSVHKIDQT